MQKITNPASINAANDPGYLYSPKSLGTHLTLANIIILLLTGLIYYDILKSLGFDWINHEENSHGIVLALYAFFLIYSKIKVIKKTRSAVWLPGLLITGTACFLFIAGYASVEYYSRRLSFVLMCCGILSFLYGFNKSKYLALPLLLIFLAIPLPTIIINDLTLPLKLFISALATNILDILGIAVYHEGNLIQLPGITLEVVNACSGIRSIFSLVVVAIIISLDISNYWKKCVLLLISIGLAIITNAARITITGIISSSGSKEAALGFYHGFSGWITFVVSLVFLLFIKKILFQGRTKPL